MRLTKPALLASLCLLLSAAAFAQGACPAAGSLSFPVTLAGSQFGGPGSNTGFGTGFVTINPANSTATIQLNTIGLGPNITNAGLFNNGRNVLSFFDVSTQGGDNTIFDQNGNFTRTMTLAPGLLNSILANPSNFNVGISTGEFPSGAVSGSLMNGPSFGGALSGANVVGAGGAANGGGAFSATVAPNATTGGSTLFFNFTPTGVGTTFNTLSLNQGAVGTNGAPFINLADSGTLTNGRFTGSVPLSASQAQALLANPGAFNVTANTPGGALRAQFGVTAFEQWFPVAGNVRGALGNQWTTDLRVYNTSSAAPATVSVELFPSGPSNITAGSTMNSLAGSTFTVNARNTNLMTNVTQGLLSTFSGLGALRITSDQPIIAVERIYDLNANGNGANVAAAAQPILGRTMCDAVARGVLVGISSSINGSSNVGVHSNIGFFNPTGTVATVLLGLNSSQGSAIGTMQAITLQPFQMMQMPLAGLSGNLFNNVSGDIVDAVVSFQSSAPIFAYTSVVNNASGDTHVTFARPDFSAPATPQADLAAIVLAANQGEVQEGQLASSRASSALVQQFAQQMVADHSAALTQAQSIFSNVGISQSPNNPTALFLQAQTQQDLAALNALSGAQFDRVYMQMQVTDHQKMLQMIDTMLIPSASATPQVVSFLQQMRATVAQHLATAQGILAQLP